MSKQTNRKRKRPEPGAVLNQQISLFPESETRAPLIPDNSSGNEKPRRSGAGCSAKRSLSTLTPGSKSQSRKKKSAQAKTAQPESTKSCNKSNGIDRPEKAYKNSPDKRRNLALSQGRTRKRAAARGERRIEALVPGHLVDYAKALHAAIHPKNTEDFDLVAQAVNDLLGAWQAGPAKPASRKKRRS